MAPPAPSAPTMLTPYRVLDLTKGNAHRCARILGDMGADVVKVEPPKGDSSGAQAPFAGDLSGPDRRLWWLAFNAGKRGITLDLETVAGALLKPALALGLGKAIALTKG